jgi:membrane-associated phospholipid phosphatase
MDTMLAPVSNNRNNALAAFFLFVFVFQHHELYGQKYKDSIVPISTVFHNIGWNVVDSITYNYGMNFIGAVAGTYISIQTKLDWEWRNTAYNNPWLSNFGLPGLYIGYVVPAIAPILTYTTGRFIKDERLQITGLALAQSLLLTLAIQSPLKMISGRSSPKIVNALDHRREERTDDFSTSFSWFNFNFIAGWPSGHTASAFSAAATIAQIYPDKPLLKIGCYIYAVLIGLGVTMDVHWLSEALSGGLIGYAIGTTVGWNFNALLHEGKRESAVGFYYTLDSIGIRIRL